MKRVTLLACFAMLVATPSQGQTAAEDLATIRNYVKISDDLATSGQISYDQIESLREEGYQVVVNLATANEGANAIEGYLVTQAGMTYVHIPVSWQEPSMRDLKMFFDVMEMTTDRKVFVHCFANMRASAFTYLYRTLVQGIDGEEARKAMDPVWDPMELEQWAGLIHRAQTTYETD